MSGETRRRSRRPAAAGQLAPRQRVPGRPGRECRAWDGRLARRPSHLGHPAQDARSRGPTPLKAPVPSAAVAEFRSTPAAPASTRHPLRLCLPVPGAPRPHLGAGAGPAHRPEQQQRQAERPRGAGHGEALRTGSSLPPAEPRTATNPGRAAGEEPARGRPARGRGQAGSPAFLPHPPPALLSRPETGAAGSEPPRRQLLPGASS